MVFKRVHPTQSARIHALFTKGSQPLTTCRALCCHRRNTKPAKLDEAVLHQLSVMTSTVGASVTHRRTGKPVEQIGSDRQGVTLTDDGAGLSSRGAVTLPDLLACTHPSPCHCC